MFIHKLLYENAEKYPDHIALEFNGESISYKQLYKLMISAAIKLKKLGLTSEDKLLIFAPNSPEFVIAFFSSMYLGSIVVLADTKYNQELKNIIIENKLKFIVTDEFYTQKIDKVFNSMSQNERKLMEDMNTILTSQLRECSNEIDLSIEPGHKELDDEALILYTSGSRGTPKGVINTNRTLYEALCNYQQTVPITSSDRLVAVTPFFHSYAMGSCMLAGLGSGATLILQESFQPKKIIRLIEKEKATIFHGVPYMYSLINEQYQQELQDFESLKLCVSAGGALSRSVAERFYELTHKVIHQEYGSSETGTISINLNESVDLNILSVGQALKNVQVRVTNMIDQDVGLIEVKNKGHSKGYLGKEQFGCDWYSTGDLGKIDSEGYIYILGREKRMINLSGLKVDPSEVERVIASHDGVAEVLVRGLEHEDFGEIVEALVVRKNCILEEINLIDLCKKNLALYKVPKLIRWVDELPKTSLGKVRNGH